MTKMQARARTFRLLEAARDKCCASMFTGIVEEVGRSVVFERRAAAWRLSIDAKNAAASAKLGDSIAVNGCCLTVAEINAATLSFDLLEETCRVTNLKNAQPGTELNIEKSLRGDGLVGGHFVTGHVDAVGTIESIEARGADRYLRVRHAAEFSRFVIAKGSIAIDGVSLTIFEAGDGWFSVWLIPHTLAVTTLGRRAVGASVNLEFDLLAKYINRALAARSAK